MAAGNWDLDKELERAGLARAAADEDTDDDLSWLGPDEETEADKALRSSALRSTGSKRQRDWSSSVSSASQRQKTGQETEADKLLSQIRRRVVPLDDAEPGEHTLVHFEGADSANLELYGNPLQGDDWHRRGSGLIASGVYAYCDMSDDRARRSARGRRTTAVRVIPSGRMLVADTSDEYEQLMVTGRLMAALRFAGTSLSKRKRDEIKRVLAAKLSTMLPGTTVSQPEINAAVRESRERRQSPSAQTLLLRSKGFSGIFACGPEVNNAKLGSVVWDGAYGQVLEGTKAVVWPAAKLAGGYRWVVW